MAWRRSRKPLPHLCTKARNLGGAPHLASFFTESAQCKHAVSTPVTTRLEVEGDAFLLVIHGHQCLPLIKSYEILRRWDMFYHIVSYHKLEEILLPIFSNFGKFDFRMFRWF